MVFCKDGSVSVKKDKENEFEGFLINSIKERLTDK